MHALSLLVGELSEQCINRSYIGAPMINSFISTPHLETPNEDEFDGGGPLHKDASGNFTPRSV